MIITVPVWVAHFRFLEWGISSRQIADTPARVLTFRGQVHHTCVYSCHVRFTYQSEAMRSFG